MPDGWGAEGRGGRAIARRSHDNITNDMGSLVGSLSRQPDRATKVSPFGNRSQSLDLVPGLFLAMACNAATRTTIRRQCCHDRETPVRAATGCHGLEREIGVGLREIRRVSRCEISQAGRDALALARFAILRARSTQQLHPGPCNFPRSCNPSVMRSNFALA
jgi:hypothetical protein